MKNKWGWIVCLSAAALMLAEPAWAAGKAGGKTADGLALFIMLGAGITAFIVWGRATFPHIARRADKVVGDNTAWKPFWVGLVNAVAAFLLAAFLGKIGKAGAPPVGLLAVLVLVGAAVTAFRGGMAVWPSYGHRVLGADDAPTDFQATLAGGGLLTGMLLLFPVGFVFFAYVLVRSLGIGVLMLVNGQKQPAEQTG